MSKSTTERKDTVVEISARCVGTNWKCVVIYMMKAQYHNLVNNFE